MDKDYVIINGHTRYLAAQKLELTEVPVIVATDLNETQVKAFRLADNKVAEIAEWDDELLEQELEDIIDIDMSLFGFEDVEFSFEEQESDDPELTEQGTKEKEIECPYCGEKFLI